MTLRFVTEDPEKYLTVAESNIVFAAGDGPHEVRLCKGLTERFDGNKINVLNFKSPLRQSPPLHRRTGLASLAIVRAYIDTWHVERLVWSCDKEHLMPPATWVEQVISELKGMGMSVSVALTWNDAARLNVVLGSNNAILWCALTGMQRNLEENLSRLIELEFGQKVAPDKPSLRLFLRSKGLAIDELIRQAKKENLKQAMSSLFSVFGDIEQA